MRQLALLLADLGDEAGALSRWKEVLELEPNDMGALAALEREASSAKAATTRALVALLGAPRLARGMVDDERRIRLRRATLLEQRLGRADEARAELEALTAATGDNSLSVLRVLADLGTNGWARRCAPAPLWLRASAVAQDRATKPRICRVALAEVVPGRR